MWNKEYYSKQVAPIIHTLEKKLFVAVTFEGLSVLFFQKAKKP